MKKLGIGLLFALSLAAMVWGEQPKSTTKKAEGQTFYVYNGANPRDRHFCPSNWMGSFQSLKFSQNFKMKSPSGDQCIRVVYDVNKDSDTLWAGILWADPCNSWATRKGGWDLTGFKKLTFMAKGEGYIQTFKMGGIPENLEPGDTAESYIEGIDLTPEWKKYEIDLKGLDLSHVICGFGFATPSDMNPKNVILYLDKIKYEK